MKKSTDKIQEDKTAVKSEDTEEKNTPVDSAAVASTRSEKVRQRAEASRQAALNKAVAQLPQ